MSPSFIAWRSHAQKLRKLPLWCRKIFSFCGRAMLAPTPSPSRFARHPPQSGRQRSSLGRGLGVVGPKNHGSAERITSVAQHSTITHVQKGFERGVGKTFPKVFPTKKTKVPLKKNKSSPQKKQKVRGESFTKKVLPARLPRSVSPRAAARWEALTRCDRARWRRRCRPGRGRNGIPA